MSEHSNDIHADRILILDYGSQYTQLIARNIRDIGVYCEIYPWDVDEQHIAAFKPKGLILSGGPESTTGQNAPSIYPSLFDMGIPVLGICYGMQAMATHFGGQVSGAAQHEFGHALIRVEGKAKLLQGIDDGNSTLNVWMSHGDHVTQLPEGFCLMASSDNAPIAGMANEDKGFYGLQFHPEVTHTPQGKRIFERFVVEICACQALWKPSNIVENLIANVRDTVGNEKILLGLSGGVDSSVVAALLHQAIGDQLTAVFVDNGLLRLGEADQVMRTFAQHMGVKVIKVDARQRFYDALASESDPEKKRKIIGNTFIEVFDEESSKLGNVKWLAQGTIYPDVIESAGSKTGKAHVIKSHHNVGGLPEYMKMQLVEPLRELFKDEVRKLGLELGLPSEMVFRHPFPGPGLGVRILGEVKPEYADILRQADDIFISELRAAELYDTVSQAFTVFLPVKSVGVKGDARAYEYVVALRCVETIDFMTARWSHLPYDFLGNVSNRIMNEVRGISRVVYDISGKPPSTIEWE